MKTPSPSHPAVNRNSGENKPERQAGIPRAAGNMRLWQYKNRSASAAVTQTQAEKPSMAANPAGNSSSPTKASRDIHEVRGLMNTLRARSGRPISSQTHNRPSPTSARPMKTTQSGLHRDACVGAPNSARAISRPVPAPPQMKLPAARQSQLVCSQGLGPNLLAPPCVLLMCPPCPRGNENQARCPIPRACESSDFSQAAGRHCCRDLPGHQRPAHRRCRN